VRGGEDGRVGDLDGFVVVGYVVALAGDCVDIVEAVWCVQESVTSSRYIHIIDIPPH
jgi:hypothetical protein